MSTDTEMTLPAGNTSPDLSTGSVWFIGNATVLIRYAGFTSLTNPTFIHMHEQVPLEYGLHTKRLTNPAIEIHELPLLDLIVLLHFHGDHFDQVAEQELDKSLPIVTTPEATKELGQRGFNNTYPLDTWSSLTVGKGDIRFLITSSPDGMDYRSRRWCYQRSWEVFGSSNRHRGQFSLGFILLVTRLRLTT